MSARTHARVSVYVSVCAGVWRAVWKVGSGWYESYTFANGSASFISTYILFNPIPWVLSSSGAGPAVLVRVTDCSHHTLL